MCDPGSEWRVFASRHADGTAKLSFSSNLAGQPSSALITMAIPAALPWTDLLRPRKHCY